MMSKFILLLLIAMAVLAIWGRHAAARRIGRFCTHCGRRHPCGCPRGQA